MKTICDVMNTDLITIEENLSFDKIIKIMIEKEIGRLPVIEKGELVGVVTRNDILVREEKAPLPPVLAFWDLLIMLPDNKDFKEKLKKISAYTAKDIMSKNYLVVKKTDVLSDVVTKIVEENHFAIVADGDSIEGIITKTDLIKNCFN